MLNELEKAGYCHRLVIREVEDPIQSLCMYAHDFWCVCDTKEAIQKAIN